MKGDIASSAEASFPTTEPARDLQTVLNLQVAFLALSYFLGAWQVALGGAQTYDSPLSIVHIIASVAFVALAGIAAPRRPTYSA